MTIKIMEDGGVKITWAGMGLLVAILIPGVSAVGGLFVINYRVEQGDADRGRIWADLQRRADQRTMELTGIKATIESNAVRITRAEDAIVQEAKDFGKLEEKTTFLAADMQRAQVALGTVEGLSNKLDDQEEARNQRNAALNNSIADLTSSLNAFRTEFASLSKGVVQLTEQQRSSNQRLDDLLNGRLIPTPPYTGRRPGINAPG